MKTVKIKFLGLGIATLFFTLNLFARDTTDVKQMPLKEKLQSEITRLVQNPELQKNGITEAEAKVRFYINKKNEIIIQSVGVESDYLKSFIRERLNEKKLDMEEVPQNRSYLVDMLFRVE